MDVFVPQHRVRTLTPAVLWLPGAGWELAHVDSGAPPLLIIQGEQDEIVPYDQAIRMKRKYESAGLTVEFVSVQNAGHYFASPGERAISPSIENIRQRTIVFLESHLVR